ncbi:MAG: hypothetical protein R3E09_01040 [Novosphingobium sp.]
MKRAIVAPAALPPSALAELKQWLGITTTYDNAPLFALLRMGLEMCEAFTGTMPLEAECEEALPVGSDWQALSTRPVQAITSVEGVLADGSRVALATDAYAMELDADGTGRVRITSPGDASRVAVRFTAGLAPDWASLPDPLRHGTIRLAAHQHRERETSGAGPLPPAAVAALWRPWRRMRLA